VRRGRTAPAIVARGRCRRGGWGPEGDTIGKHETEQFY
jgi:hypothetical protein